MKQFLTLLVFSLICAPIFASDQNDSYPINLLLPTNLSQNAFDYVPKNLPMNKSLLSEKQQHSKANQYLGKYFFPWSKAEKQTIYNVLSSADANGVNVNVLKFELSVSKNCDKDPCYDMNYQPITHVPPKIIENMALQHFPNVACDGKNAACYGIMTHNAAVRDLPTNRPFYANPRQPGEGYPFDYLQDGDLWRGAPVQIIQHSQDNQWLLVQGQGILGWVKNNAVAHASENFRKNMENSRQFITPIQQRNTFIANQNTVNIFLGAIYPELTQTKNTFTIAVPIKNAAGEAVLKPLTVLKGQFDLWPLATTPFNFSVLINQMINMPYSWGGLNLDSDCSGTLTRIYSAFGIWLAPNSLMQGQYGGKIYPVAKENRKAWLVHGNGPSKLIPYLALITLGGKPNQVSHVMMYLGSQVIDKKQHAVVFQQAWGIHIRRIADQNNAIGRAIFGRAIISTIGEDVNFLPALKQDGLTLNSVWDFDTFNVTVLTEHPQPVGHLKLPSGWDL